MLRKLYVQSQPHSTSPSINEYLTIARDRSEVLGTIKEWLCTGGGAQDALDDINLFGAISSFLDSPTDHLVVDSPNYHEPAVRQAWRVFQQTKDALISSFASQTKRPKRFIYKRPAPRGQQVGRDSFDFDSGDAEQLVEYLDGMAYTTFGHVTEEVFYIYYGMQLMLIDVRIGPLHYCRFTRGTDR